MRTTHVILNKSWKQHPIKQQWYDHLPPISYNIKVWQERYTGHSQRSRVSRPAKIYIHQPCTNTGCRLEDTLDSMTNKDGWQKRVKWTCAVCLDVVNINNHLKMKQISALNNLLGVDMPLNKWAKQRQYFLRHL